MSLSGQTSALLILIVLIIFGAIAFFLLNVSKTADFDDYTGIYANNLLLASLRANTGYENIDCSLVSDLLLCSYFTPNLQCDGAGPTCQKAADDILNDYMSQFSLIRKNYRYLFVVEPQGFVSDTKVEIGDTELGCDPADRSCPKMEKFVSTEIIQRGSYAMKVQLILARSEFGSLESD